MDGGRHPRNSPPRRIPKKARTLGAFLFWGKLTSLENFDPDEVVGLFGRLLPIYEYVEFAESMGSGTDTGSLQT